MQKLHFTHKIEALSHCIQMPRASLVTVHTHIYNTQLGDQHVYLLDIPKQPTCMKLRTGEFYEHILSCAM